MKNRRTGSILTRRALLSVLAGSLVAAGCASKQPVTGRGGVRAITQEEIRASEADDVLELIQQLRPAWLTGSVLGDPSNPTQGGGPSVLINDIPPKPLFSLQFLPLDDIREIRYLTRTAAETRFRVGATHGLILVLTESKVVPKDTVPPDTGHLSSGLPTVRPQGIDKRLAVYPGQPAKRANKHTPSRGH